jgi:uncharacterized protein YgiM (DUF1202 family)
MVFGDDARREDVTRASRAPAYDFSFAAFVPQDALIEEIRLQPVEGTGEAEAVAQAIEAGRKLRDARVEVLKGGPRVAVAAETAPAEQNADAPGLRFVSGSKVNLRAGPGTTNAVVAQLTQGTAAQVLTVETGGWVEIVTTDGTAGWISAKFLSDVAPS